jgi:HEAT repeat protein
VLALAATSATELYHFEFGEVLDPPVPLTQRVDWILADFGARRHAFVGLSIPHCVELLSHRIEDAEGDAARLIPPIRGLGFLRSVSAAPLLQRQHSHPSIDVQREAILSLGRISEHETLAIIEASLDSPVRELRRAAIIGLSRSIDPEVFARMERAAGVDSDLQALVRQGRRRLTAFQAKDPRAFFYAVIETEEYDDLIRLWDIAENYVAEVLRDRQQDRTVRRRALWLVSAARFRRAGPALAEILTDERDDPDFLLQATIAAGRCQAEEPLEPLVALLDHPDPRVQEAAIVSLGEIALPQALRPLLGKWNARDGALREQIRLAAFRVANVEGAKILADTLRSGEEWKPAQVYFIDDGLELFTGYRAGLLDGALSSENAEARRDAILLMAYLAGGDEAAKMDARRGEAEPDPAVRELAELAAARMRPE